MEEGEVANAAGPKGRRTQVEAGAGEEGRELALHESLLCASISQGLPWKVGDFPRFIGEHIEAQRG